MDLIYESKKANKAAFKQLIDKYYTTFYKAARIYLKNENDLHKVLSSTLEKTYSEIVNCKTEKDFVLWELRLLFPKAQALHAANLRKKKKEDDERAALNYDPLTINDLLKSMPDEYKEIAFLYYYVNLYTNEIARLLKIPEPTVINTLQKYRVEFYELVKHKEAEIYYERV